MRHEKKVAVLAGTTALLLVIWTLGLVFSPERVAARAESLKLLQGSPGDAASIEISGQDRLSFAKEGGAWYLVQGAAPTAPGAAAAAAQGVRLPADASRMTSFLEAVGGVKRLRPLARSREAWAGFQLDEAKGKRVVVKDGKGRAIADFWVGGYGPTGTEVYLRRSSSDESYAVSSGVASYLGYGRKSWLDLRVLPTFPETDVQSLAFKASIPLDGKGKAPVELQYRITREREGWKGPSGALDAVAAESLVRALIGLQGEDISASPPPSAFTPVSARIDIELGAGTSKVLEVGSAAAEGRYFLRLAGSPLVFEVSAYSLRAILKPLGELVPKKQ
jgi:hypothetical protein